MPAKKKVVRKKLSDDEKYVNMLADVRLDVLEQIKVLTPKGGKPKLSPALLTFIDMEMKISERIKTLS